MTVEGWEPGAQPEPSPKPAEQPAAPVMDGAKQEQIKGLLAQVGLDIPTIAALLVPYLPTASITQAQLTASVKEALIQLGVPQRVEQQAAVHEAQQIIQTPQATSAQGAPPTDLLKLLATLFAPQAGGDAIAGLKQVADLVGALKGLEHSFTEPYRVAWQEGAQYAFNAVNASYKTGGDPSQISRLPVVDANALKRVQDAAAPK